LLDSNLPGGGDYDPSDNSAPTSHARGEFYVLSGTHADPAQMHNRFDELVVDDPDALDDLVAYLDAYDSCVGAGCRALGPLPDQLPPGEFVVETLMPISMVIVVRKGNPLARARRLADLGEAPWVYTGATPDSGYAKVLYERNGLKPPPAGALVNSTLGLLSILTSGNCVGLLPQQIAAHPIAGGYLDVVDVAEGPLQLTIGALARAEAALKPSVRHFLAHLHRAAHHLTNGGA
jgi:DNA-binding transcriptional LysR family regulator